MDGLRSSGRQRRKSPTKARVTPQKRILFILPKTEISSESWSPTRVNDMVLTERDAKVSLVVKSMKLV